jgi:hypothetical protein
MRRQQLVTPDLQTQGEHREDAVYPDVRYRIAIRKSRSAGPDSRFAHSTVEIAEWAAELLDAVPGGPASALLARALGLGRALRSSPRGRDRRGLVAVVEGAKFHGVDMAWDGRVRHVRFPALSSRAAWPPLTAALCHNRSFGCQISVVAIRPTRAFEPSVDEAQNESVPANKLRSARRKIPRASHRIVNYGRGTSAQTRLQVVSFPKLEELKGHLAIDVVLPHGAIQPQEC